MQGLVGILEEEGCMSLDDILEEGNTGCKIVERVLEGNKEMAYRDEEGNKVEGKVLDNQNIGNMCRSCNLLLLIHLRSTSEAGIRTGSTFEF
nr:unnamed protein product [Callosobruchus chinensis]